ncbi:MAG: DNA repair protein RecN [Burkholderiales bacterium]|jgi:DNA repair protein RecN (Recombination protein N)|nr:DNA repair protein RecN [Burkholderiales bacterium]MCA3213902.1 DNA repair protein RecN [Burkholderiales bacterium]MCA3225855.1 DNA repair protein RecN [Burkholderiales bacterium]MCE2646772.1 DNA repair protein RecN [Burkholderiaceae bacterium]
MLLSLSIRNFVIVESLDLEFGPGFSVLTGETGAGKSILIDALLLALGERAEADVVREGAARAEIGAEFRIGEAARDWIAAQDLGGEDAGLVLLRRTVDAGGRSRAFINGSAVTLAQLRELGELLVDVHGQHAHQSLLKGGSQQRLLDEHGGLAAAAREVAQRFAELRRAGRARAEAEAMAGSAQAEADRLRWTVEELDELAPQPGEWEAVEAEHRRLSHAAGLLEGAQAAVEALGEGDAAALERIDAMLARLQSLAQYDARLAAVLESLGAARVQLDDAVRELNRYLGQADLDGARLAQVEARVAALHAAARKLRSTPAELPALLADAQARLAALSAASDLEALRAQESAALARYTEAARALSKARVKAARQMAAEVTRAMQDLSMAGGRFEVNLVPLADGETAATGAERVEFLVAGHAGVAPKPLVRVASGGELARISLAIAVIAASATPVGTLIFDEVDAGIGGAVAETVGRLLRQLGQQRQVLCVTHLPQVAACGDAHLVVSKAPAADGRPVSQIRPLDRKSRVDEIARMLGGIEITETTRKHARELLS